MMYEIHGGNKLEGEITIGGAKNAILPLLACLLVCDGVFVVKNFPKIADAMNKIKILERIGVVCKFLSDDVIEIDTRNINVSIIEFGLGIRTSILLIGGLISRFDSCKIPLPKGDKIGERLHDMHVDILTKMGLHIAEDDNHFHITKKNNLQGVKYKFRQKSVGATQNSVIAASIANGITVLENCAMEVEVSFLCKVLNTLGANINGIGTETLTIIGRNGMLKPNKTEIDVIPDRLQAVTYLLLPLFTLGEVRVVNKAIHDVLHGVPLHLLAQLGAKITLDQSSITCSYIKGEPINYCMLQTGPYPGLGTDLQPLFCGAMLLSVKVFMIYENIYENRFQYVSELKKQGANLSCYKNAVTGKFLPQYCPSLDLLANDIRSGALLTMSSLNSSGVSHIHNVHQILRGYENFHENLTNLGARIRIMEANL